MLTEISRAISAAGNRMACFSTRACGSSLGQGVTLFEAEAPQEVLDSRLQPGGKLVHRTPEAAVLAMLAAEAEHAGASGVLYFALAGPGMQAAFSPAHLAHRADGAHPQPVLEIDSHGGLVLSNPGPLDLPTRRWELEILSDRVGAFQSASPGGFAEADIPGGVPAELAGTMVLRFSKLAAGQAIRSGPLIRNAAGLTWKIRSLTGYQAPHPADSTR